MTITDLRARRRQARSGERARCLADVRDELRGMVSLLGGCVATLENHASIPAVERQLVGAALLLEGLVARIEKELHG